MMRLFLTSEAKHPQSLKKINNYIKDLKSKTVAYIPTAVNGRIPGAWKRGESIQVASRSCKKLNVVELEDYIYKDVISEIREADVIWIAGGMSGYLTYWVRRVELDKALPEILDNGTVYIGSSAGSMICSKTQVSADWYLDDPEPGVEVIPGLGFIDFEIYPHYKDSQYSKIKKLWKKGNLCLLKDGEAIVVEGKKIKFLGKKRMIKK